jgi:hypothetical protein
MKSIDMSNPITPEFIDQTNAVFANATKESLLKLFEFGRKSRLEPKGEWVMKHGFAPYYKPGGSAGSEIQQTLYQLNFIVPFKWSEWEDGQRLAEKENRTQIVGQPIHILLALLTNIIRADRFNEGLYDGFIEDGLIATILEALEKNFHSINASNR